jgi:hypothetical protein
MGPSFEGDITEFSSTLIAFNFGTIEASALHLLIFNILSPSSLRVAASNDPTASHGSLNDCLRVVGG